jgi:hypothetical protein
VPRRRLHAADIVFVARTYKRRGIIVLPAQLEEKKKSGRGGGGVAQSTRVRLCDAETTIHQLAATRSVGCWFVAERQKPVTL